MSVKILIMFFSFFHLINRHNNKSITKFFFSIVKVVVNSFFPRFFLLIDIYSIKNKEIKWIFHMKKCQMKVNINFKKIKIITRFYIFI
jgi:hypothetical protein